ncbi:hypothetical protein [Vibrio fortis]|uniref:hypothetical protein n=1 Tax=Vibrio fortis TaxID=212667 RepID=UPI001CD9D426|nr:hypothetical protein [Vibrio fortis]
MAALLGFSLATHSAIAADNAHQQRIISAGSAVTELVLALGAEDHWSQLMLLAVSRNQTNFLKLATTVIYLQKGLLLCNRPL